MPHPESEHGLRVQLATAIRERDEARADAERMAESAKTHKRLEDAANARADAAEAARNAFARQLSEAGDDLAAARRETAEALERAAQIADESREDGRCIAFAIRALASPAAAPAAEPSEPAAPAPPQMDEDGCCVVCGRGLEPCYACGPAPAQGAEERDLFAARLATQLVYARARIAKLEAALREAQGQLCAEHCEWTGSGEHDDQCVKLSKALAARAATEPPK